MGHSHPILSHSIQSMDGSNPCPLSNSGACRSRKSRVVLYSPCLLRFHGLTASVGCFQYPEPTQN